MRQSCLCWFFCCCILSTLLGKVAEGQLTISTEREEPDFSVTNIANQSNAETIQNVAVDDEIIEEAVIIGHVNESDGNEKEEILEVIDLDDLKSEAAPSEKVIIVEDYLNSLSDKELEAICYERGFDITHLPEAGHDESHKHYVEAARRCLSLDNEINAVLAKNPDLAAELEKEIDRMRVEKERLEAERESILAEKVLLEEQLKALGVDLPLNSPTGFNMKDNASSSSLPQDASFEEVLRESFTLLLQRVYQDIKLVVSVLKYVSKPVADSLSVGWRYSQPTINIIARKALLGYSSMSKDERVKTVFSSIFVPIHNVWTSVGNPLLNGIVKNCGALIETIKENEYVESALSTLGPKVKVFIEKSKQRFAKIKASANTWVEKTLQEESLNHTGSR